MFLLTDTLLCFIGLLGVLSGQELALKPQGDIFTKSVGSSMVVSCIVDLTNNNHFPIHWIDNNNIEVTAEKIGRVFIEDDGPTIRKLYILIINETDAGQYTCRSKINGSWQQKSIRLTIFKDITFINAPIIQNPAIDTDALIFCQVNGNPFPTISWRYQGTRIHLGERFVKEEKGLKIHGINLSDNGFYTCRAEVESDGRYDERRINVTVHIPPKITIGLKVHEEGVEGTDLSMSCQADGLPSPIYKFFKDDSVEEIVSSARINIEENSGNIYFSPLEKEDEGKYLCQVSNDVGIDSSVGSLRVFAPPMIVPMREVERSEGETAEIECRCYGDPTPEMSFHRIDENQDYQLGENDDGRIIVTSPSNDHLVISISHLLPSDAGNLTCRARSSVGSDEAVGLLKVLFAPRFADGQSDETYVWAGKKQNMTYVFTSNPMSKVEWFRNGNDIRNNETYQIFISSDGISSSLQVRVREFDQGWIYGDYLCRATNSLGEADRTMHLHRASAPAPPQSVVLLDCFPTMVILKSSLPDENGGMPVFGYRVEYEDKVQDFMIGEEIRINDLKPSTTYIFRVRAKNDVGIGHGKEINVVTEAIRQPYPIEITSSPIGEDSYEYTVTWNAPITGGLAITQYKFSYRRVLVEKDSFNISQPLEDWTVKIMDDLPLNYHRLDDLLSSCHYELEIKTRNSIGWSDPNRQFVFITDEDPFAVTILSSTFLTPSMTLLSPFFSTSSENEVIHISTDFDSNYSNEFTGSDSVGKLGSTETVSIAIPIVIVVVGVFLLFLVIVDISCYFMNSCGVTMFICIHICGRDERKFKDKSLEEGESDKKPLSEEAVQEMEPLASYHTETSESKVPLQHDIDDRRSQDPNNRDLNRDDERLRLRTDVGSGAADESTC